MDDDAQHRENSTDRAELLGWASDLLGNWAKLKDVFRHPGEHPSFVLVFDAGQRATLDDREFGRLADVRRIVEQAVCRALNPLTPKEFQKLRDYLLRAALPEDLGEEVSDPGGSITRDYLQGHRPVDGSTDEAILEALKMKSTFMLDGRPHVHAPSLRTWCLTSRGDKHTPKGLGKLLRAAGWEPVTIDRTVGTDRCSREYWRGQRAAPGLSAHVEQVSTEGATDGPDTPDSPGPTADEALDSPGVGPEIRPTPPQGPRPVT